MSRSDPGLKLAGRVEKRTSGRQAYDAAFKLKVVYEALQRPVGQRIKPTCREYPDIEPVQLRKWIRNLAALESAEPTTKCLGSCGRGQPSSKRSSVSPPVHSGFAPAGTKYPPTPCAPSNRDEYQQLQRHPRHIQGPMARLAVPRAMESMVHSAGLMSSRGLQQNPNFMQPSMAASNPMMQPTSNPMMQLTSSPMMQPTSNPMMQPTSNPMMQPTSNPMMQPTSNGLLPPPSVQQLPGGYLLVVEHSVRLLQQSAQAAASMEAGYLPTDFRSAPHPLLYNNGAGQPAAMQQHYMQSGQELKQCNTSRLEAAAQDLLGLSGM